MAGPVAGGFVTDKGLAPFGPERPVSFGYPYKEPDGRSAQFAANLESLDVSRSAKTNIFDEQRLDVNNGRPIQSFETAYGHSPAIDSGDLDLVQTNWIGAVG